MKKQHLTHTKLSEINPSEIEQDEISDSLDNCLDPDWDYLHIFKLLVYVNSRMQDLILSVGGFKKANSQDHAKIDRRLEELITYIQAIRQKLK